MPLFRITLIQGCLSHCPLPVSAEFQQEFSLLASVCGVPDMRGDVMAVSSRHHPSIDTFSVSKRTIWPRKPADLKCYVVSFQGISLVRPHWPYRCVYERLTFILFGDICPESSGAAFSLSMWPMIALALSALVK